MRHFDTVVIGGGAAGIMAAGMAASKGAQVLLCEKMEKPQRKVRITGKGRCNLTNLCTEEEFLNKVRAGKEFFTPALHIFGCEQTRVFFEKIGVPLTLERGRRIFPQSGRAWDIAEAHIAWCRLQGVRIECLVRVEEIATEKGHVCGVRLRDTKTGSIEVLSCRQVILATGGASYPATGSTGEGYVLAHRLGHTIVPIRPSLTPLRSITPRSMEKLHLRNISLTLLIDGNEQDEAFGEMEFAREGVSGPVVLKMSRKAVDALIDGAKVDLRLDLKPALSREQLTARLARESASLPARSSVRKIAARLVPAALIDELLLRAGIAPERPIEGLSQPDYEGLISALKSWMIPITDYAPFEEAIVTAGGVSTQEVDPQTLQSHRIAGLYFAGEILDLDADTGGYNLQIAYSTGYLAGMHASHETSPTRS